MGEYRSYNKGSNNPMFGRERNLRGEKNPMFGKHHSEEAKAKIGRPQKGDKNAHWKGGITKEQQKFRNSIEFALWREAVFARDSWICQGCGKRGGRLNAHHIKAAKQSPELRLAIDNGLTLCLECHRLTDNYAGRANGQ